MTKLTRADLMSLEQYAEQRSAFREKVLAHKAARQVAIGPNATLYFEDRLTIQYQIQEMLRVERIFEAAGIEEELAAYNPLIPDGANWKATFMLEFPNPEERKLWLAKLIGIERQTWVQINGFDPVLAIANEDLSRETAEKTAAVHFMRFELSAGMVAAVKAGAQVSIGINHPNYTYHTVLGQASVLSLAADLS
ncbi:MAG: DUF3501 family protein [Thiothrix sp.]|nr:MAG: DUF3501 family protein [Thiothrix sp.]